MFPKIPLNYPKGSGGIPPEKSNARFKTAESPFISRNEYILANHYFLLAKQYYIKFNLLTFLLKMNNLAVQFTETV